MSDFAPAVFTRDNPCTKVEIHNCFYRNGRYVPQPVVQAKTVIGENVPKYLLREELVIVRTRGGVDYYDPTAKGDNWMRNGILRFLANHPERIKDVLQPPVGFAHKAAKKTRPGAVKPVEKAAPSTRRLIRRTR